MRHTGCRRSRAHPRSRGKTAHRARSATCQRVHPRSRGENLPDEMATCQAGGSSPLAQGKPQVTVEGIVEEGIIPAHAGKTLHDPAHRSASTAHPRSHRENVVCFCAPSAVQGSSPLTRGKHGVELGVRLVVGLTPRSRGENRSAATPIRSLVGSSPLTRGKRDRALEVLGPWRLIPAHAGKTGNKTATAKQPQAHPRSRGENSLMPRMTLSPAGSSPLTRGKHGYAARRRRSDRLIPAHAGKTSSLRR